MPETGWFKQLIIYFSVTEARQHKINVFDGLISCGTLLAWTAAFSICPSRVETDRQRQRLGLSTSSYKGKNPIMKIPVSCKPN